MRSSGTIPARTFALAVLQFAIFILQFSIFNSPTWAAPAHPSPTLARLSFWVPPQSMSEFETAYETKIVPILKAHGLVASSERGRATPDSVFSRLFEFKTPSELTDKQTAFQSDPEWKVALQALGASFGTPDNLMRFAFGFYAAPAGPGKVVSAGHGKTVAAGRGTGHWRTYDATDGLPVGYVRSILQDRDGNLWFGTWGGGVSRYDGQRFTTFFTKDGLAGNYVYSSLRDREGVLWFGTIDGVSRYDGQKFTTFTIKDGLTNNQVFSIFQDRDGVLWFGTGGGGVSRYDGKSFITFTTKDGLAGNVVASILQDREGVFWFGTFRGGVSRYDPSANSGQKFTTFTTKNGLGDNRVWSISQDREGHLWFSTWGGGVSRYDPSGSSGQKFTTFSAEDGLVNNAVYPIFQDQEGHLWFGTFVGGVSRYDGYVFTTFTPKDGLANKDILSAFQDREGNLWFGTSNGLSRYDGKTFTTFTTEDGLPSNHVPNIFQDREGNLWFGTSNGLSRYDRAGRGSGGSSGRGTFTTFTTEDGLPSNHVFRIFQDREGNLWFGSTPSTAGGVSRYDGKTFTALTTEDGLADNLVASIFQDRDGFLWFGTGEGVSRYDGKTFTTFAITVKEGLAHNRVRSIFQDREGNLWFGTDGGVSRYDGKTFTAFTTQDGLAGGWAQWIFQDREGNLWFGTQSGGVSRYDGKTFQTLTHQDGLASNVVTSIIQDRDGVLWFGTDGGLTRYRPPAPLPPPVFIDAVVAERRYEKVSTLAIPSTVKLTAFEFRGMSFKTRPEAMVYRYRLQGYDKDWRTTHERRVEYSNLPRGTYTFEVQAVDRDLVYSEKPASVALRVHLPYERVGWLTALSIAVALVAWQTGRVIQRDRKLQASNTALSTGNRELFTLNRTLQETSKRLDRERAVERVRAEVTAMKSEEDLRDMVGEMLKELAATGVDFDLCVINIIDEQAGVRRQIGATKEGWFRQSEEPIEKVSEGFRAIWKGGKPVIRQVDDGVAARYFETRRLLGIVERGERPTALVDAPFEYGTLSLSTHRPGGFSEEDVALIGEFARVVALGYARYLDFQQLEEQNRALAEANRQVHQANQAKSAFLANMSHELRTPLNSVIGMSDILMEKYFGDLTPQQEDYIKDIRESGHHLLSLINDILDLSKIEAGHSPLELSKVDLKPLLENSLTIVRERAMKHGIALSCEATDSLPEIVADERKVKQAVFNLLSNAVKFTPDGGKVGIKAKRSGGAEEQSVGSMGSMGSTVASPTPHTPHTPHTPVGGDGPGEVEVCVWDTGIGIAPEDQGRVFGEFVQAEASLTKKYEGTGLGLALVKRFVEQHGGRVWLESEVDKGSRFYFTLPVEPTSPSPDA